MIVCPICGGPTGAGVCKGTAPAVLLTLEQRLDIGEISEKEYRAMTDTTLPSHQHPRDEPGGVLPGAEHGYVGVPEDEKFDRPAGGWSNAPIETPTAKPTQKPSKGKPA